MRVVINTTLSLTASCLTAFAISSHLNGGLFSMEDVLNATLAGGVIVGSTCDMFMYAWQPLLLGGLGGAISSFGFNKLSEKMSFHDTCGVHNLHGIPGILGGLAAALMAS